MIPMLDDFLYSASSFFALQEMIVEICPTSLFTMINTIYNIYLYMVLMTVLPFMFLLVLNAFIVYRQSRRVNSPATHHTPSKYVLA
jgi:hypothetical protein